MCYIEDAFYQACEDAVTPEGAYVCLMEEVPFYGGPEEGGWWGSDIILVAYKYCETEEEASVIKEKIEKLASQLQQQAQREYGQQCLREMNWCEERGYDADYLREPDGPSTFSVKVCEGLPQSQRGNRQYS